MATTQYEDFIRQRITELRLEKNISEHRMSLDLDKSGSYIRGITSGGALPSVRELFNIMSYFELSPSAFFAPLENAESKYHRTCERIRNLSDDDLDKVNTAIDWIEG